MKISEYGDASALSGGDFLPLSQGAVRQQDGSYTGGTTAKATVQDILDLAQAQYLTSAPTYYVRATGSDSNTGLVNTAAGAFQTVQRALAEINKLQLQRVTLDPYNNVVATIQLAAGVYAGDVEWSGFGKVALVGDTVTPGNVHLTGSVTVTGERSTLSLQGVYVDIIASAASVFALNATHGATLALEAGVEVYLGIDASHGLMAAINHSRVLLNAGVTLTVHGGVAASLFNAQRWSSIALAGAVVFADALTLGTGSVSLADGSTIDGSGTFAGAAVTGKRFVAINESFLQSHGVGLAYFPGTLAGIGDASCAYDGVPLDNTIPASAIIGLQQMLALSGKERLIAPRVYYVDPVTGNDTNDGRASNSAFRTIQHAIDYVSYNIEIPGVAEDTALSTQGDPKTQVTGGYNWLVIQLAVGTYNENLVLRPVAGGRPFLRGNRDTIAGTKVVAGAGIYGLVISDHAQWRIGYFHLDTSIGGQSQSVYAVNGADLEVGSMQLTLGTGDYNLPFAAYQNSKIVFYWGDQEAGVYLGDATLTVHGSKIEEFMFADFLSGINGMTANLAFPDNPVVSRNFLRAEEFSYMDFTYGALTGTVTGTRFRILSGSNINTYGGGASFIPGDTAGIMDDNGGWDGMSGLQYNGKIGTGVREALTADRTYYVDASIGSDVNDGRSAIAAFRTVQKAVDTVVQKIDLAGKYQVIIQLAHGTYVENLALGSIIGLPGAQSSAGSSYAYPYVTIQGDSAAPQSVLLQNPATEWFAARMQGGDARWRFKDLTVQSTRDAATAFSVNNGAQLQLDGGIILDGTLFAMWGAVANDGGSIAVASTCNLTLKGNFYAPFSGTRNASLDLEMNNLTFAVGAAILSMGFVTLAVSSSCQFFQHGSTTGTLSGKRFQIADSSAIYTQGSGLSALPGSQAGSCDDSSSYDGVLGGFKPVREILSAPRVYYVDAATGNDTNDGLSAGTAFRTIQHAIDFVSSRIEIPGIAEDSAVSNQGDPKTFAAGAYNWLVIQLAAGTYNESLILRPVPGGRPFLRGNRAAITATKVIAAAGYYGVVSSDRAQWKIAYFHLDTSVNGVSTSIYAVNGADLEVGSMEFTLSTGNYNVVFSAYQSAKIVVGYGDTEGLAYIGDLTLTVHGSKIHEFAEGDFQCALYLSAANLVFTDNPVIDYNFLRAEEVSYIYFYYATLTGTITGTRFHILSNSNINTYGSGASFIPGSVAGVMDDDAGWDGMTGLQYNGKLTNIPLTTDTSQAANFTISQGKQFTPVNTATGPVVALLPAAPNDGEMHIVKKVSTDANSLTIDGNGKLIDGAATQSTSSAARAAFTLVYHAGLGYWSIA